MYMKKLFNAVILFSLTLIVLGSCSKEINSSFDLNADVHLRSFTINQQDGEIDQENGIITVRLPFGTNLSSLSPSIELPPNASITPKIEGTFNFTGDVSFHVTNGNLYKDYTVKVIVIPPLKSFTIDNVTGTIDQSSQSITVLMPDGVDLSNLTPLIQTENGILISPASGVSQNFSEPVLYTVTSGNATATYTVTVISNSINEYAFLGLAATRDAIVDPDEKTAADWFFLNYPASDYISFQSIESGRKLSNYKVIWWHYDAAQDLPDAALNSSVVKSLKTYRANGGNLLLTTFAARYVEALGIVSEGRGPNNAFGDFGSDGFVEQNDNWGISFRTHEDHPIFEDVETYEPGKAWLLEKGTFRQNHTAWWFLPEWGGYGNGANWREQTGGINLASEAWDDNLDGRVGLAEWKTEENANVVIIAFGAYDWYSEPLNGGKTSNAYIGNIQRITKNAINYLRDH